MKAFLAEYAMLHEPSVAKEGEAMLRVLKMSFERCGFEVVTPSRGNFAVEIQRLARNCDVGLVIAPDHLLSYFTKVLEEQTHNLGCGSLAAALCANKQKTGKILRSHGIAVPEEPGDGLKVVKPILGYGSIGVRLTNCEPGEGEFSQRYIDGENVSVSLIGSRVVGEACLYFSGKSPLLLAVNRQFIDIRDGYFSYTGGETPIIHPREDELIDTGKKVVSILGCQGYAGVDMVVADRIYVVDVNPRITTSILGIATVMKEEIADLLVRASHGSLPPAVHLSGHVRFQKEGRIFIE